MNNNFELTFTWLTQLILMGQAQILGIIPLGGQSIYIKSLVV